MDGLVVRLERIIAALATVLAEPVANAMAPPLAVPSANVVLKRPLISNFSRVYPRRVMESYAPVDPTAALVIVFQAPVVSNTVANAPLLEDPRVVPQANIVSEVRPLKASSKFVKPKSLMDMLVVPMEMCAALATVLTEYVVNARLPALPLVVGPGEMSRASRTAIASRPGWGAVRPRYAARCRLITR
jgi:hypothetical protein